MVPLKSVTRYMGVWSDTCAAHLLQRYPAGIRELGQLDLRAIGSLQYSGKDE